MNGAIDAAVMRLGNLTSSSYLRAIATLSSGQVLAALLPLLAAPILGRLYLPTDYGALAAFMALVGLFGAVSTLQLQQGIIAERSELRARELVLVATTVAGGVALLSALTALILFVVMGGSEVYAQTRSWVLMLPFTVLAGGATAAIAALANRRSAYGSLARIPVLAAVVTVSLSIALGLLGMGAHGLFISYFCGQAIGVIAHLNLYRRIEPERPAFQLRRQVAVGWRHRDFARYTVPSQFLSVVSLDMPVYALTAAGSIGLLGAFHRARALVSMPLGLIGSAVAQVFRQRASEDYRNTGSCRPLFVKTGLGLFVVGLPPFILLMLYAPDLFRLVLGPNWGEAGEVARILAPMLLLRLVCSPLSTVFSIVGAQRESFLLMIYSTGLCAAGLALVFALKWAAIYVIYGFALTYAVIYIAFLLRGWALAMNPRQVPSPIQSRSRA